MQGIHQEDQSLHTNARAATKCELTVGELKSSGRSVGVAVRVRAPNVSHLQQDDGDTQLRNSAPIDGGPAIGPQTELSMTTIGGVPVAAVTFDAACALVGTAAPSSDGLPIRLVNAWSIALSDRDADYREVLCGPGVNLPDGAPVSWAIKVRHFSARKSERVRGPSMFWSCTQPGRLVSAPLLLGGTEEVLHGLDSAIRRLNPKIQIAGMYAPPYAPLTDASLRSWATKATSCGATHMWVGLGTPKQDYATAYLARATGLPCIGVGAAFGFYAGSQRQAPSWVQRIAFEWLFRLLTEPKRLWRRYLIGNVRFVIVVARRWRR